MLKLDTVIYLYHMLFLAEALFEIVCVIYMHYVTEVIFPYCGTSTVDIETKSKQLLQVTTYRCFKKYPQQ